MQRAAAPVLDASLASLVALASLASLASFVGCSPEEPAATAAGEQMVHGAALSEAATSSTASSSRGGSAAPPASSGVEMGPAVSGAVEPAALDELLAAAPKMLANPTDPDGGTAVGTKTHDALKDSQERGRDGVVKARPPPPDPMPRKPRIAIGPMAIQSDLASASIERAARAQLYWGLVQRCRDKAGEILPPDVITIVLRIDEDGYIVGSSIIATPSLPIYEDAAHCMRRELSSATFRSPLGARGMPTTVTMTVPSVD